MLDIVSQRIVTMEQAITLSALFPQDYCLVHNIRYYADQPMKWVLSSEPLNKDFLELLSMTEICWIPAPTYQEVYERMRQLGIWLCETQHNEWYTEFWVGTEEFRYKGNFTSRREILPQHYIEANIALYGQAVRMIETRNLPF